MDRRAAIETLFDTPWITLYRCDGEENWFSSLVAPENLPKTLSDMSWDLHWGQMRPCIVTYGLHDDAELGYERFQDEGIEPIVIARERVSGPFFVELAEDIRLFFNLFPCENGNLVRSDENGDEEVVVTVSAQEVQIRKGPLLRYLQARQMYLAVYSITSCTSMSMARIRSRRRSSILMFAKPTELGVLAHAMMLDRHFPACVARGY